jgi:hypothetical protein
MSATCTQHDLHAVRCGCGRVHVAERPDGVADTPVGYGPNLQAWCVCTSWWCTRSRSTGVCSWSSR